MTEKKNEIEYRRTQALEKDCWEDDIIWTIEKFSSFIGKNIDHYSEESRVVNFNLPETRLRFKIKCCSQTKDRKIYYNLSTQATLSYEVFLNSLNGIIIAEAQHHSIPMNKWLYLGTLYNSIIKVPVWQRNNLFNGTDLRLVFKYKVSFQDAHINNLYELSQDFGKLFCDEIYSDATVRSADGLEFKVHKNILATRSAVFKAQFAHGTTESFTNKVDSPFEGDVLHNVLMFMYSNRALRTNEISDKLLEAADYYHLDGLKRFCAQKLYESLTIENAVDILKLADRHQVDNLIDLTLLFLKDKASWLLKKSETWDKIESVSLLRHICRWLVENDDAQSS